MSNSTIIFATGNSHKVEEVKLIIGDNYDFKTLKEINWNTEIIEDGTSYHQNAMLKAKAIADAGHHRVLSEDSGLEVDCLGGDPGIYTARFATMQGSTLDNNTFLLQQMEGETERQARFIAVVCLIDRGEVQFFQGTWEGKIAVAPYGKGGFGYDPIFIPNGYEQTTAELGEDVKRKESHRAKAFLKFKTYWENKS